MQKELESLIEDLKKSEPKYAKIYQLIKDRVNQSFSDGDVTSEDLKHLLDEPAFREILSKIKESSYDIIDNLMNKQK